VVPSDTGFSLRKWLGMLSHVIIGDSPLGILFKSHDLACKEE
jgi:hypothetical protein